MSISYIAAASSSFLCECKVFYSHSRSDSNPKKKKKNKRDKINLGRVICGAVKLDLKMCVHCSGTLGYPS